MDVHVCVGIYPNGDKVINHVADVHLPDNIAYNKTMRPGRYYFVDGEYVCGGILRGKAKDRMIAELKAQVAAMDLSSPAAALWPYR